jgi:hypothetical protein
VNVGYQWPAYEIPYTDIANQNSNWLKIEKELEKEFQIDKCDGDSLKLFKKLYEKSDDFSRILLYKAIKPDSNV